MALNVFTDGASKGNPGEAGGGFIVYRGGDEVFSKSFYYGRKTNNQAEYLAIINSIEYLIENNLLNEKINFLSDSQFLVKQILGEYSVKSKNIIDLYSLTKKLLEKLNYSIQWIPREENEVADSLANKGIEDKEEKYEPKIKKNGLSSFINNLENSKNKKNNHNNKEIDNKRVNQILIEKSFFGKINCLKIQLNNSFESYFHLGILKGDSWNWIKIKFNDSELGEILNLLKKEEGKCSFYHKFSNESRQIWCSKTTDKFSIKVGDISKNLIRGEIEVFRILIDEIIRIKIRK